MEYATQQDMVDRFGSDELINLTDRQHTGAIDSEVVSQALLDANSEIDAYLASRYELPLASAPQSLVRIACDIARYRLYDEQATETVSDRYKAAVRFLDAVAKGSVRFGPSNNGQQPQSSGEATINSSGRVFGRDGHGFI